MPMSFLKIEVFKIQINLFSVRKDRERALSPGRGRQDEGLHLSGVRQPQQRTRGRQGHKQLQTRQAG